MLLKKPTWYLEGDYPIEIETEVLWAIETVYGNRPASFRRTVADRYMMVPCELAVAAIYKGYDHPLFAVDVLSPEARALVWRKGYDWSRV